MKFRISLYPLLIMAVLSCSDTPRQTRSGNNKIETASVIINKPSGIYFDTIKIDGPAAVFYSPDSLQLEKMKTINDTLLVESIMHDCFYQMKNSRIVLKQYYPYINIIEAKNVRYLLFEMTGGEKEYIDLDSLNDPCAMIIFNSVKKAQLVDMTNVETQLGFYFSK